MSRAVFACIWLVLAFGLSALTVEETSGSFTAQKQKKKANSPGLNLVSMEVRALETLHNFKATAPQLQRIARIAKNTKAKVDKLEPPKAAAEYGKALKDLREALIANDQDAIEKRQEQLGKIEEKNPPELDDEFDITDAARNEVDGLYLMLSLRQLVLYADSFGEDLPEPVDVIVRGLEATHMLKDKEWEEARDDLAREVSWLVAGMSGLKSEKIRGDVAAFLNRQHGKSSQATELVPPIRRIIGTPDALVVLRNLIKHDLALLLSNPQLERVVQERLKNDK